MTRTRPFSHILSTGLLLLFFSCASSETKRMPSEKFSVSFKQQGWNKSNSTKVDHFYYHNKSGQILFANSYCNHYQDDRLETISQRQFAGIKNLEIKNRKVVLFRKREAVEMETTGLIDGVNVNTISRSLRKDNCLYDFIFISTAKLTESDKRVFSLFVNGSQF